MSVACEQRTSWMPLVVVAIAQVLLAFNITALKISIDAIVVSYAAPASAVKTAIVAYSLVVASCIAVGARAASRFGSKRVFRTMTALFAVSMLAIVLSNSARTMIVAQMFAGIAAAAISPTSAVLIADNYSDGQRAKALSLLSAVRSLSLAPAFLLAGILVTWSSWRIPFAILSLLAASAFWFGAGLSSVEHRSDTRIDAIGFLLALFAIFMIGMGFNSLNDWGFVRATSGAPFSIGRLSPAPFLILAGVALIKVLVVWSHRCRAGGRSVLIAPEILGTPQGRSVLFSIFTIGTVSAAVTFLIPLYIEVVQGRNSLHTALAMIPFTLSSVAAAILIGRLHNDRHLRFIGRYGFLVLAVSLALLGTSIRNDWSDYSVIISMSLAGFGEGALATLLLRLILMETPREDAGDTEPLCSATSHLAVAVGTAFSGALVIALLGLTVQRQLSSIPDVAEGLRAHVNLDRVAFVSNDHLLQVLKSTSIAPEHLSEAVRINTQARLQALKISFFTLSGIALFAFVPSVLAIGRTSVNPNALTRVSSRRP
jgi:MFS family permease